jgi:hypothetical protein
MKIHTLKSFDGDEVIEMLEHEMQQHWRDIGGENILIKTSHLYKFRAPTLHEKIRIGSLLEIDGVVFFVDVKKEKDCIAIGEEYHLRKSIKNPASGILAGFGSKLVSTECQTQSARNVAQSEAESSDNHALLAASE